MTLFVFVAIVLISIGISRLGAIGVRRTFTRRGVTDEGTMGVAAPLDIVDEEFHFGDFLHL